MKYFLVLFFLLTTFCVSAQSYTSYFTGNTTNITSTPSGGICLMGGATEDDEAMKWFLQRANGGDILVLRASGSDGYNTYLYSDLGIPVNSVETIVFHNATASNETYIHQKIMNAEAIWFAGGDQWNYVSYWRETPIQNLINDALQNRNIVIGGTSAGMAIQGSHYFSAQYGTVTSNTALNNPYDTNVTVANDEFINNTYLNNVITDTHYDDPDRRGRHAVFLARMVTDEGIIAKGIACDEYTAVCIDDNGIAKVYGGYPTYDDNAYFIQVNCEVETNIPEDCSAGNPLHWEVAGEALKVYNIKGTFAASNSFDLNDWTTASGGNWQNWYVTSGNLVTTSSTAPNCVLSTTDFTEASMHIYPNPTSNSSTITLPNYNDATIMLYDIHGRNIMSVDNITNNNIHIDLSSYPSGMYLLRVETTTQIFFRKLIKK